MTNAAKGCQEEAKLRVCKDNTTVARLFGELLRKHPADAAAVRP
jgi:hypothetical protein